MKLGDPVLSCEDLLISTICLEFKKNVLITAAKIVPSTDT